MILNPPNNEFLLLRWAILKMSWGMLCWYSGIGLSLTIQQALVRPRSTWPKVTTHYQICYWTESAMKPPMPSSEIPPAGMGGRGCTGLDACLGCGNAAARLPRRLAARGEDAGASR